MAFREKLEAAKATFADLEKSVEGAEETSKAIKASLGYEFDSS